MNKRGAQVSVGKYSLGGDKAEFKYSTSLIFLDFFFCYLFFFSLPQQNNDQKTHQHSRTQRFFG